MPSSIPISTALLTVGVILLLAQPAHAFGAGNIGAVSKIEGLNWRHGDIEDTLLSLVMSRATGKKFDKMNVARVYFGNWLRDYSQAIDVGTVKYVSAEAIRILLWVLGFMTFGFGTKEFEVTTERLGCYRPEDHIDNPKDYADNLDATQYDRRLRGLIDERVELAIDPDTGLKNYIANERAGCMTSALHVRKLFGRCIQLGRAYKRNGNKADFHESLRLLGTALHCLEDYSAHSNYTELALIEMGERDVFPHVGRDTEIRLQGARGPVFPIVTGTFGGVDFLHSVMGEVSDKATQSEIQELEGTMQSGSRADTSRLKDLLNQIPSGLFGGADEAGKADELQQDAQAAQMNQMRVSPRDPEEYTKQMQEVVRQIYPAIQWHDEVMMSINEAIEQYPVLPELIEQFSEQLSVFVFSLIAPFVLPIISQIKTELETGSSEIIQSSKDKQLIVFHDDRCSDPTHSMLSKDHFSNILNEPAGKIASQVLKWVVPQIVECWDDERIDPDRTVDRIIHGVFHHPAQRQMGEDGASDGRQLMFRVVEDWWRSQSSREQDGLRRQLSRQGVESGQNHKEGVHDKGHGCGKPLKMSKPSPASGLMGLVSSAGGSSGFGGGSTSSSVSGISKFAEKAAGGGALGGLVGALAGGVGGSLLGGAFGGGDEEKKAKKSSHTSSGYAQEGGYQQSYTGSGNSGDRYAQAQYSETQRPGDGHSDDYQRYNQTSSHESGLEQHTDIRPGQDGGYVQRVSRIYEQGGDRPTESYREGRTGDGHEFRERESDSKKYKKEKKYKSKSKSDSEDSKDDDDSDDSKKRYKKEKKEKKYKKHGSGSEDDDDRHNKYSGGGGGNYGGSSSGGYGGGGNQGGYGGEQQQQYGGGGNQGGYGGEQQQQYGGGRQEYGGGRDEYGGGRQEQSGGRQEYGGGGYGEQRQEYGGGGGYQERPRQEYGESQGGGYGGGGYGERRDDGGGDGYSQGGYGGDRR